MVQEIRIQFISILSIKSLRKSLFLSKGYCHADIKPDIDIEEKISDSPDTYK